MFNVLDLSQYTALQDFITFLVGIVVEAFPFVILGVAVSVLVELFVKDDWLLNRLPKNTFLSHLLISTLGIFMPVCECGNVPVVRRFLTKGLNVSHAVTFLLAAPIVNPITFWTTLVAFSGNSEIAYIRVFAALLIANGFGLLLSFKKNQEKFLANDFYQEVCDHHDHPHTHSKLAHGFEVFQKEFITVFKMLIIGSAIAAASQVFISREFILLLGGLLSVGFVVIALVSFGISKINNIDFSTILNKVSIGSLILVVLTGIISYFVGFDIENWLTDSVPNYLYDNSLMAIVTMMVLAFVVSICANVDAFFAIAYTNSFSLGSITSFLVFGPMIDIKMLAMLRTTFTAKFLWLMTGFVALMSLLTGLVVTILL